MVSHHARRGGQDFNAKAVVELRQTFDLRVNTAARGGNALQLADDRLAGIVFQLDLNLLFVAAYIGNLVNADETFILQNFADGFMQL